MGGEQRSDGCVDCDETGDDDESGRDYGDDGVDAGDGHGGDTKYVRMVMTMVVLRMLICTYVVTYVVVLMGT